MAQQTLDDIWQSTMATQPVPAQQGQPPADPTKPQDNTILKPAVITPPQTQSLDELWNTTVNKKKSVGDIMSELNNTISTVPSAAIRSALAGKGYTKGATNPSGMPTETDMANAIVKYISDPKKNAADSGVMQFMKIPAVAAIASPILKTMGFVGDFATNPANVATALATTPEALGVAAKTIVPAVKTAVPAVGNAISKAGQAIADKFPWSEAAQKSGIAKYVTNIENTHLSTLENSVSKIDEAINGAAKSGNLDLVNTLTKTRGEYIDKVTNLKGLTDTIKSVDDLPLQQAAKTQIQSLLKKEASSHANALTKIIMAHPWWSLGAGEFLLNRAGKIVHNLFDESN